MQPPFRQCLLFASPDETQAFATALAPRLAPGDTILLEGPIGSGKTHFARSLIHARLAQDGAPAEDVPSPTFTLVQTYDTGKIEIWHADLYRLTHPDEVEELGLVLAFDEAVCLVEWPDRLASLAPQNALTMSFDQVEHPEGRRMVLTASDARWREIIDPVSAEFAHDA